MKADRVGMEDVLVLIEEGYVFRDAVFEDEGLVFVDAFIDESDLYAWVEEGEFA
jgi:hypothetical protein